MAYLPEPVDDLDAEPVSDPVVRSPKTIVALPDPPTYARRRVMAIAAAGLLLGSALGAVGIGIVYATQMRPAHAANAGPVRAPGAGRSARPLAGADGGTVALALALPDGGAAAAHALAGPDARYVSAQQRLGRGRTLPAVLRALGLTNDLASRVVTALRALVNMRSLQPTDVVVVRRDPAAGNDVRRVEYRRSDTQVWRVDVAPDTTCTAQRIEVVRTAARVATGFVVGESLEATLRDAGLRAEIVPRLQEVFASLDLGTTLHRGDVVRVIVEEERLNGEFFRYGRVDAVEYRGAMGRRRGFFQRLSARGGGDWFDAQGFTRERGPLHAPVVPARMTSPFNLRRMHPVLHRVMPHLGVDFGAPVGAPVYAAADGVVLSITTTGPTGNLVRLAHGALGVETGYAHLSRFAAGLRVGQRVRVHQVIGYVGSTGRSTGPHLHFSLKRAGQFIDPLTMYGGRRQVPAGARAEFDQAVARFTGELAAIRVAGEPAAQPDAPEPRADEAGEGAVAQAQPAAGAPAQVPAEAHPAAAANARAEARQPGVLPAAVDPALLPAEGEAAWPSADEGEPPPQ